MQPLDIHPLSLWLWNPETVFADLPKDSSGQGMIREKASAIKTQRGDLEIARKWSFYPGVPQGAFSWSREGRMASYHGSALCHGDHFPSYHLLVVHECGCKAAAVHLQLVPSYCANSSIHRPWTWAGGYNLYNRSEWHWVGVGSSDRVLILSWTFHLHLRRSNKCSSQQEALNSA